MIEKTKRFDILVERNAKLEEVILSAKKSRLQKQVSEQETTKLLSSLQDKLSKTERAHKVSLTVIQEREMEVSQLRTASQSLEHLVNALGLRPPAFLLVDSDAEQDEASKAKAEITQKQAEGAAKATEKK